MKNTVTLTCIACGKKFQRLVGEYNRNVKLGHKNTFCSLSCNAIYRNKNVVRTEKQNFMLSKFSDNRRDEYTPFRKFGLMIASRNKDVAITLEDLKNQWDKQNGICPITGWKMYLPMSSRWSRSERNYKQASVDRIDSSLGYIPGNIRWVCQIANLAKNGWSDDILYDFCKSVAKHSEERQGFSFIQDQTP